MNRYDNVFVPGNILKKDKLESGKAYAVRARNFNIAIWTGETFRGLRFKFGQPYMSSEHHYDDGEPFGTVKPLYELK